MSINVGDYYRSPVAGSNFYYRVVKVLHEGVELKVVGKDSSLFVPINSPILNLQNKRDRQLVEGVDQDGN